MINSAVVRGENLRFSEAGVKQVLRDLLIPWWNAYSFFVTYANVDGWCEDELATPSSPNELDRWIVSSLETLIAEVTDAMDHYDLQRSVRPFVNFIENLTNWYIRRSRRRFWKSQNDDDKLHAYRTLRYVLVQLSKVAAPFTPFISETIYGNLRGSDMPESVHLCEFPKAHAAARDETLESQMALAQTAVNLGHFLRKQKEMKVRQPLSRAIVVSANPETLEALRPMASVIAEELNVKDVEFASDEAKFVSLSAKANFKSLGSKLGKRMKQAATAVGTLDARSIVKLQGGGTVILPMSDGEGDIELTSEDVQVVRQENEGMTVANEGAVTLALDTKLNATLVAEGLAREFVSKVQSMRKENDFEVSQRIKLVFTSDAATVAAIEAHRDYICAETLCTDFSYADDPNAVAFDLNDHPAKVAVSPAN